MGTWGDSWTLTKTAFRMLREDRALLWIPLIGGLCLFGIAILAVVPIFVLLLTAPGQVGALTGGNLTIPFVALYVAVYFVLVFVGVFFTAALVGAATLKLNGGSPTVSDGLRIARQHVRKLLLWSLFAASVGLLIQLISSRFRGIAGLLLRVAAGVSWGIVTYFIVPVLLYEQLPTFGSLKRSAGLFVNSFGRTVASNFVLGLIGFGLAIVGVVVLVAGFLLSFGGALLIGLPLVALGFLLFIAIAVLMTAASGVLTAALYRYATTGQMTAGLLPAQYVGGPYPVNAPLPSGTVPPGL